MFKPVPPSGTNPRTTGVAGDGSWGTGSGEKTSSRPSAGASRLTYSPGMDFVPQGGPRVSGGPASYSRNLPPPRHPNWDELRPAGCDPTVAPFVPRTSGTSSKERTSASEASEVDVERFFAAQADLKRRIEASPPSADRDEALFVCNELAKYPCHPGEKLYISQTSSNVTNGLLKLGVPVPVESLGIPRSLAVQQIVSFPNKQGAGTALCVRAVNQAQAEHCEGILRAAHNVGSEGFYERMGFKQVGPMWVLQPSMRPDLWEKTPSNEWRFRA